MPASAREQPRVAWREGVETRLHECGARGLCVIEQWCAPGTGAPTHTHFDVEEVIVVVDGIAEFRVDGVTTRVSSGGSIVLPPHSWHGFTNAGEGALHILAVFAAAHPRVEYEDEPGVVLEIGGAGARRRDAHRAYVDMEAST